jgi:hypothetical protein
MADFATGLRARLIADAGVIAIAGQKVYWGIAPQGTALPYIRLNTISDPRPENLQGYDAARVTRVQADCFSSSYAQARALAEAVVSAVALPTTAGGIRFGRTKAEGPRDLGEDTASGFVHRASVDLLVEHAMA